MARKYARDNRGRFASKGAGATARGSRLKTAGGNKRDGQTIQAKGGPKSTIGKPKGLKPGAAKTSGGKWMPVTNSKGQVVGMRDRTKPAPSAAAVAQAARSQRANRNLNAAMKREADGPGSKASRSASVAKRAAAIYAGKVDAKQKTGARLTKTNNAEALRKRVKKIKDNNAAKPAAKPAASGVSAIPKGSVRRYAALERVAGVRSKNASRASSRANSSFAKPSQRDAQSRLAITEGNRAARAKATMRKLSNTPAGQQPPTLPKARAVGQRMKNTLPGGAFFAGNYKLSGGGYRGNGRWSSSGKDLSRVKAARPASTMAKVAAKPAATTGRRKPLKGVGATLAKNLSGFKGLPVSVRSRKQAAAYQGARRRSMLSYNAVSTGGTFKRGVNRQPNLLTGGVDRVGAGKFRPVYKKKRG